ncbi:MAG: ribosome biogenesis/translation initiation ATPase RLI, partial [Candidatus Bathyarchaeota archaeon]
MVRVAVLENEKCHPEDCGRICYRICPMVRGKIYAVQFEEGEEKPTIVEPLCSGCGICIKKCPFQALTITNLPEELETECSHRYGKNAFKLYRLPVPIPSKVVGLLGKNGIGKTSAIKILSGEIRPNLGDYEKTPEWDEVIRHFRGSLLQNYFDKIRRGDTKVIHKPQYIDKISKVVKGKVGEILEGVDERDRMKTVVELVDLKELVDRNVKVLSGGECQRLAIASAICREGDVYIFDEPFSYLDVKQRINAAKTIRSLIKDDKTVVVAEHDIAMLDYLSDQVCVFYGEPGVYGIISSPHGVRTGINIYLDGYLSDDNMRFRNEPVRFHIKPPTTSWQSTNILFSWDDMQKTFGEFELTVEADKIYEGEVIGILGSNGIGKTTFVKLISGMKSIEGELSSKAEAFISYKPQYISVKYQGNVKTLLRRIAKNEFETSQYITSIIAPMGMEKLFDRKVSELSGGELQKVAIATCLSKKAKLYLIDEPSAFLDVEERLAMAKIIRRVVESEKA